MAVLEMLGAQEDSPAHLLKRLEILRGIVQDHITPPGCRFILSTIHSAKGLEYDRVILLDVLDGILPAKPELACRTPPAARAPLPPVDVESITTVGAHVRHAVFGPGTVESVSGHRVTVRFTAGARTLDAQVVAERHLMWKE